VIRICGQESWVRKIILGVGLIAGCSAAGTGSGHHHRRSPQSDPPPARSCIIEEFDSE
jgi:hypothetical protein